MGSSASYGGPVHPIWGPVRPIGGPVRPIWGPVRPMGVEVHLVWGPVRPIWGPVHPIWGPVRPIMGPVHMHTHAHSVPPPVTPVPSLVLQTCPRIPPPVTYILSLLCLKVRAATGRISKNDWVEWLCQLGVELLKESPSPTLHSCWALAQVYKPLPQ